MQGDAARGRALFASKGRVVCHAINEVGGTGGPPLDAEAAPGEVDALDFVARMWRGSEAMIFMQQQELGVQFDFTGQELADIIAFVHDPKERRKFSEEDFPAMLRRGVGDQ
jgi:cytochrome c551/c552